MNRAELQMLIEMAKHPDKTIIIYEGTPPVTVNHTPKLIWMRRIPSGELAALGDASVLVVYPIEPRGTALTPSGLWALDLHYWNQGESYRRRLGTHASLEDAKAAGHIYAGDNL